MANRTRPKQIVIRVSEEELAQIKEKVEQSGKNQPKLTGVNGVTGGEVIENIVGDMEVVRVINHIKKNTSRKGR